MMGERMTRDKALAMRKDARAVVAVGLAALFALWFALFQRSCSFVATFGELAYAYCATGLCGGLLTSGLGMVLLCAKDSYRVDSLGRSKPALFLGIVVTGAILLLAGLTGIGVLSGVTDDVRAAFGACGIVLGLGLGLLMAALFDVAAPLCVRDLVLCGVGALLGLAVLQPLQLVVEGWGAVVWCAVLVLAVAAATIIASRRGLPAPQGVLLAAPDATIPERISAYFRSTWRLLVVAIASAYLLGYNWNPNLAGLPTASQELETAEEALAALAAAVLFLVLRRLSTDESLLVRLQRIIVPVLVATFVIIPYFSIEQTGIVFYGAVTIVRLTCMFVFAIGLVAALSLAVHVANASRYLAAGLAIVLCALAALAGFVVAYAFGADAGAIGAVLFVGYLIVALTMLSVGREGEQKAQALEKRLFDEYLRQRCAEMATEYGLSRRESEMLVHLGRGHGYVYIAELEFVSESTVRAHAKSIFKKCGVSSREELINLIDRDQSEG